MYVSLQMLTLHYLDNLTKQLRDLGYTHLTLPVLALEDVLSRSILKNHSLNVLVHVRYGHHFVHLACARHLHPIVFMHIR